MLPVLFWFALLLQDPSAAPFPTAAEFERRVWEGLRLDEQLDEQYTYIERRRDVKMSRLGKVTIGPPRTFEVYPGGPGQDTYKRLIAVDGKPLSDEELAKRDAEHQRDLDKAAARRRNETPRQRQQRLEEAAEERRKREALVADAREVFEAVIVGREAIEGRPVLVADVRPRPDAPVRTREGGWMKKFAGRVWVAESNYQIVRLDMHALEDVTIGWGIIGRLHRGSRVVMTRQFQDGVWLTSSLTYEASGRTLLFRPFQFTVTATYSDYRRFY